MFRFFTSSMMKSTRQKAFFVLRLWFSYTPLSQHPFLHLSTFIFSLVGSHGIPHTPPPPPPLSHSPSTSSLRAGLLLLAQGLQQETHGRPLQTNALQFVLHLVLQAAQSHRGVHQDRCEVTHRQGA